jgi:hypothetical protein
MPSAGPPVHFPDPQPTNPQPRRLVIGPAARDAEPVPASGGRPRDHQHDLIPKLPASELKASGVAVLSDSGIKEINETIKALF